MMQELPAANASPTDPSMEISGMESGKADLSLRSEELDCLKREGNPRPRTDDLCEQSC